jgi:hypothetical protein
VRGAKKYLDEREATKAYFKGGVSFDEYLFLMRNIQEIRHNVEIEQKGNKMSMSSTKWK